MRFSSSLSLVATIATFVAYTPLASAVKFIESKSLNPCQTNSSFSASLFDVVFTPINDTIAIDVVGESTIDGNVTALLELIVYGYTAMSETLNPCEMDLEGLCPMSTGNLDIETNIVVSSSVVSSIPAIAYSIPDFDGQVRIYINSTDTGESVACVEADLSNGKTVDQKAVGWVTAVIAGLGLAASAITSGLGHSNTAAHVAANALSLFGFFQAQAFIGMTAVPMPPIVESWTQNFQWSMGIIEVDFLESICTWYQRATGGTPSTTLTTLSTTSVEVLKRSLDYATNAGRTGHSLMKRTTTTSTLQVVKGIDRVGFVANIESTNIFLTGMIFFVIFCAFVAIFVGLFKLGCELAAKQGWMKGDKFSDFRNGWKIVLKGILFRIILIGYPQMSVLCLWELVERDSPAEIILGIIIFLTMTGCLGWAALKVIRLAKRSVVMHKNPAYVLYSDPTCLNKWGFLYVQYRATAYYWVLPVLGHILVKSMFIAFAQASDITQAVALLIIEGGFLVAISVIRPWMDKKTNVFNISIGAVNFFNAILLVFFTSVFDLPGLVTGVMGVVFFVVNAVFALVLLLLVLIASIYAIASKNPDTRYQPMRDDRGSFIKSQNSLHTTELDALGATARGDMKESYGKSRFGDEDDDSLSSESHRDSHRESAPGMGAVVADMKPPSTANSGYTPAPGYETPSTVSSIVPSRTAAPPTYDQRGMYSQPNPSSVSAFNGYPNRSNTASPQPYGGPASPTTYGNHSSGGYDSYSRTGSMQSYQQRQPAQQPQFRQQNSSSPWQRGAGYE